MEKIFEVLKRFWRWSRGLTTQKEWIFTFPTVIFALLAFILHSIIMAIVLIIWIVTIIHNTNEE
jgi:hypothetical protein